LADLLGQVSTLLATEEFTDGRSSSTLLVYFSGILGFSADVSTFRRPRNYTSHLSALIHSIRLLCLETTLPRYAHVYVGWNARPRHGQLQRLDRIRRRFMCAGTQAPMGELLSLRSYGRAISASDGPSFRVLWSDDGQTVSWDDCKLTVGQFRELGNRAMEAASASCDKLMYGYGPEIDLGKIRDVMSNTAQGYSFVQEPKNGLSSAYLNLSERACLDRVDGLMSGASWDMRAVYRYFGLQEEMLRELMVIMYLLGGQAPRTTELFSLEYCNGPSTSRGVYVHSGRMVYITRHTKARRATNQEFHVARYLPRPAGLLLFKFLVYILPFTQMLRRVCSGYTQEGRLLFCSPVNPNKPWTSHTLSVALQKHSRDACGHPFGVRTYRQLSIAVTEKHVKNISKPFNRFDDKSVDADLEVVFAWQSGHRPMERGVTYGLDGAFPDSLQPALLRVYEWASTEWHRFLMRTDGVLRTACDPRPVMQVTVRRGQNEANHQSKGSGRTLKRKATSSPRTGSTAVKRINDKRTSRGESSVQDSGNPHCRRSSHPWSSPAESLLYLS
jgi:hypothetical protein